MGSFYKINFPDILDKIKATNNWLQDVGLDTANSRLTEIMGYMTIICDHHKRNDVGGLVQNYDNEIL
jgi:hypothetical protein